MHAPYRIELLGGLQVQHNDRIITRFRTYKAGALLAYLAYYRHHQHPREVLIELLWPECDLHAGRNRLSTALSSLRRQLEPPGVAPGAIILADRASVRLNSAALTTDVAQFEAMLRAAEHARGRTEREQALVQAVEQYRGPLLTGCYEEWIATEQERLADRYLQAIGQLIALLEQEGDLWRAIDYAYRAVSTDPLREEAHRRLMRLQAAAGQPATALRQYRVLERILREELGQAPAAETRHLAEGIGRSRTRRTTTDQQPTPGGRGPGDGDTGHTNDLQRWSPTSSVPKPRTSRVPGGASSQARLPARTVSFLRTDLEPSAAPGEPSGTAFQAALDRYHALLQRELRRYEGRQIPEAGDAVLIAFDAAGDALGYAIAVQRSLIGHAGPEERGALWARIVLHTGDTAFEADVRGPVLYHTSRMLVAAHGGQILCSETTASLLRRGALETFEPGVCLRDLGAYRLAEPTVPERLFQVEYPEMPRRDFPPLKAAAGSAGNLPLQLTRFFGRHAELARLRAMLLEVGQANSLRASNQGQADSLPRPRLITLTGPGGSGKTRLALQVAAQLARSPRGLVWFVPLVDLLDSSRILDTVRDTMHLPPSPHLSPLEQVVEALSPQPSLLLLDNFEHLVTGGAPVVRTLLEQIPTLTCLVTSRQRLSLDGEREFAVPPLPIPMSGVPVFRSSGLQEGPGPTPEDRNTRTPEHLSPPEHRDTRTPEHLMQCPSVQLFVDRAQAVRPDFQVTHHNAATIAKLCEQLEGVPLALELAAARAQVLTPAQMLRQLERRLDFLVSRRRDAVARHRTLRAALEWGNQLLSPELQRCFAELSVFCGGWTAEAAAAVCSGVQDPAIADPEHLNTRTPEHPHTADVLEYLAQLRECSLIQVEEGVSGIRFRMLETLREYASEQVDPAQRAALEHRHARYYHTLAEETKRTAAQQGRGTTDPGDAMAHLEPDLDNLRAALAWGLESEPEFALRLALALAPFWWASGSLTEERSVLEQVLARTASAPAELREEALSSAGCCASVQGDCQRAEELFTESLAISRARGNRLGTARTLRNLAGMAWIRGEFGKARALAAETLSILRELGHLHGVAACLTLLGSIASHAADYAEAHAYFEESREVHRQRGSDETLLVQRAILAYHHGSYTEARVLIEEKIAQLRAAGRRLVVNPLIVLGLVACRQGEYQEARTLLGESLILCRKIGDRRLVVECLEGFADVAEGEKQPRRAAQLLGAAAAIREAIAFPVPPRTRAHYDPQIENLRAELGTTAFTAAWGAGFKLTWQQAIDKALETRP